MALGRISATALCLLLTLTQVGLAQTTPDILYLKFNDGPASATANFGTSGVASPLAPVSGHSLATTGGQFAGALVGAGGFSGTNSVDTGWAPNLTGSWTISLWVDQTGAPPTTSTYYLFGGTDITGLRGFANGIAGIGNTAIFGPVGLVVIPGGAPASGPAVSTFVYDAPAGEIRGYLNGTLVTTAPQSPISLIGPGFRVGGFWQTAALATGVRIDEFRVYGTALTSAEVAAAWNTEPPVVGLFAGFTASAESGPSPAVIQFTDISLTSNPSGVASWAWDFESDGTIDSTAQNPSHIYPPGTYDVTLTVTDGVNPNSTLFRSGLIHAGDWALQASTTGTGDLTLIPPWVEAFPGTTEGFTLVSANTIGPVGGGGLFGIYPDGLTWPVFFVPAAQGNVVHFLPAAGFYPQVPLVVPPGGLNQFLGMTLDFAVLYSTPGAPQASNTARVTF